METDNTPNRLESTAKELYDYVNLRVDRLKLQSVEQLSVLLNKIFFVFLLVMLLSTALIFFAVAFTWWLAGVLNSLIMAASLVGGLFIVVAFIVFSVRRNLLTTQLVKMFSKMFFDPNENSNTQQ